MLHHGAKNADNIYRGSTSLGSEVDILVGMAASPINANARALSPVGRVEGLEGFVVVSDKQTHEWTRVGQHEIRDALETKDEDLERAVIKVATVAGPTFKSQFRTRLRDGGVHVRATDVDAMVEKLVASGRLARQSERALITLVQAG